MNGLKIAPMKLVTALVMTSNGPEGVSAAGGASACLVCGVAAALWVADDLDDVSAGLVLAVVTTDGPVAGVASRVVSTTTSVARTLDAGAETTAAAAGCVATVALLAADDELVAATESLAGVAGAVGGAVAAGVAEASGVAGLT